ncbi:MAG: zinc ribbon domain-containing protein [Lachnospiraceae bacterium]|nr:zinc ribbon domain-containing protein [Lachnospiraceae bacterium]
MNCKRCGTELRNDDEFCYRCGQRTSAFQRMFGSRAFIGSVIAILVVAVAAVLTYFIWTGQISFPAGGKGEEETVQAPEESGGELGEATGEPEVTAVPEATATPYVFEPAEVTEAMRAELKPLTKKARPFLAFGASYYENNANAFRWDNETATVMALYNLYQVEETVGYGDTQSEIRKAVKKEIKRLFGGNFQYNLTYSNTFPNNVFRPVNNTLIYNVSPITGRTYSMTVDKIIEYQENKYRVIVSAGLVSENNKNNKGYFQKYTLYVNKDENSEYGYTIEKIKKYKKKDGQIG